MAGPPRGEPGLTNRSDLVPPGHQLVGRHNAFSPQPDTTTQSFRPFRQAWPLGGCPTLWAIPLPPSLVFGLCPVVHYQGLDPLAMDGGPTPLDTHSSVRDRLGWDVTPPPQEWGSHLTQLLIGVAFHGINFSLFPVPSPQTFFIHSGETLSGETPVMYYQAVGSGLQGSPTGATTNTL